MTMAAGIGVINDEAYTRANCLEIARNREYTTEKLRNLGFVTTDSKSNFIFAKHPKVSGATIYQSLKSKGILVRHFSKERISDYVRITVGTSEQMTALLFALKKILEENNDKSI